MLTTGGEPRRFRSLLARSPDALQETHFRKCSSNLGKHFSGLAVGKYFRRERKRPAEVAIIPGT
jgi:hypothetical protein